MDNIKAFKPNILIESMTHGEEYIKNMINTVSPMGIEVISFPYFDIFKSSTAIKKRIKKGIKK